MLSPHRNRKRRIPKISLIDEAGFTDVNVFWMKTGHAIFGGRKPDPETK